MKSLTKGIAAGFGRVLDSVREMRHPGQATLFASLLRRTRFDYASEVGDGLDASVVTAPVMWMQRSIPRQRWRCARSRRTAAMRICTITICWS